MNSSHGDPKGLGFAALAIGLWMVGMPYANWFDVGILNSQLAVSGAQFVALALLIAAIFEFLRGSSWHGVFFMLFSAYGWAGANSAALGIASTAYAGWWALTWALIVFFLWIGVFKAKAGGAVNLLTLGIWLAFLAFAIAGWSGLGGFAILGGYLTLASGVIAFYAAAGEIINASNGSEVLPAVSERTG